MTSYTKGERVKVIDEKLARGASAMVSNGDTGTIKQSYNDGFVEVAWDKRKYPDWDIQIKALAKAGL